MKTPPLGLQPKGAVSRPRLRGDILLGNAAGHFTGTLRPGLVSREDETMTATVNRIEKHHLNGRQSQEADKIDLKKPGTYSVLVTPEIADLWLRHNCENRRVRASHVTYLVNIINSGGWTANHPQPIIFAKSGKLLDGQHRLIAIRDSRKAVWCKIEGGVPDEVRKTIDTGLARKLEDRVTFSSDEVLNKYISQITTSFVHLKNNSCNKRPTAEYENAFLVHSDGVMFAAAFISRRQKGITRAGIGCALVEMFELDQEKATAFAESLVIPNGKVEQARMLRDWCLRSCESAPGMMVWYEKAVYCMNAYLDDREVTKVLSGKWTFTVAKKAPHK